MNRLLGTFTLIVGITSCAVLLKQPQDFNANNSTVIVAGSVIQLFCSASGQFTAPNIQWTWNSITIPETSKLPHLMVKSWTQNNTITSSVLTIYGFSTGDNGCYQCNASDNGSSNVSQPLLLTAINGSNVLTIVRELNINTGPDRTSVPLGSSSISSNGSFLRCSAEQPPSSSLTAPSMIWLKDGTQLSGDGVRVVITTTNSTVGTSNRTISFVRIFNFSQSDAGVYQCVFYDTPSQGGEVITTRPYKVDTGPASLIAVTPSSISLCPPEPLVIQVEAGGEYASIQWTRTPIALNVSSDELVDFQQTFVRTVTSEEDWGLYNVMLALPFANSVNFSVTAGGAKSMSAYIATYTSASTGTPTSTVTVSSSSSPITSPSLPTTDSMTVTLAVVLSVGGGVIFVVILPLVLIGVVKLRKRDYPTAPALVYQNKDLQGDGELLTLTFVYSSSTTPAEGTDSSNGNDSQYSHLQFGKPPQRDLSLEQPHLYASIKSRPVSSLADKKRSLKHDYVEIGFEEEAHQSSNGGQLPVPVPKLANGMELLPPESPQLGQAEASDHMPSEPHPQHQDISFSSPHCDEDFEMTEQRQALPLPQVLQDGEVCPKPLALGRPSSPHPDAMEHRPLPPLPARSHLAGDVLQVIPSSLPTCMTPLSPWMHRKERHNLQSSPLGMAFSPQVPPSPRVVTVPHSGDSQHAAKVARPKFSVPNFSGLHALQNSIIGEPSYSGQDLTAAQGPAYPYSYVSRGDLNVAVKIGHHASSSTSNSPIPKKKHDKQPGRDTLKRTQSLPNVMDLP